MLHYYDLEISEVFIHENFLINQIREGKHIEPTHADLLEKVIQKHFSVRKVVYISNRINSYSVNPLTYRYVTSIENLIAMAIVTPEEKARKAAEFERGFYSKPFKIVDTLTEAVAWSYDELEKYKSNLDIE